MISTENRITPSSVLVHDIYDRWRPCKRTSLFDFFLRLLSHLLQSHLSMLQVACLSLPSLEIDLRRCFQLPSQIGFTVLIKCPSQMFLSAAHEKKRAWRMERGISPRDIPEYKAKALKLNSNFHCCTSTNAPTF